MTNPLFRVLTIVWVFGLVVILFSVSRTERRESMNEVTVGRQGLIDAIEKNRAKHLAEYAAACPGYRSQLLAGLSHLEYEVRMSAEKNTDIAQLATGVYDLPCPQNHVAEYDTVLGMLKMSLDAEVKLTRQQYEMYVENRWGWSGAFAASTSRYMPGR